MQYICSKQTHTGPFTIAHHRNQRRCSGWPSVRKHATFALQTSTCGSNRTTVHLLRTRPQLECGNVHTSWSKSDLQRLLTSCSPLASRTQTARHSLRSHHHARGVTIYLLQPRRLGKTKRFGRPRTDSTRWLAPGWNCMFMGSKRRYAAQPHPSRSCDNTRLAGKYRWAEHLAKNSRGQDENEG